ncbi:hypothetical protein M9H77_28024 [Catharanthus roseus]|uniref:Uncharacterized protein n=1 Tax=Catharanthus roseus TaxID=4058 RepID=A0ACC0AET4_CATRO|nr:hypothetical protein M9H77_28024 [Catharanthus roseus]
MPGQAKLIVHFTAARRAAGLFAASPASLPLLLVGAAARCAFPLFVVAAIAASAMDPAVNLAAAAQVSFFKPFLSFLFAHGFLQIPATFGALLLEKKKNKGGRFLREKINVRSGFF